MKPTIPIIIGTDEWLLKSASLKNEQKQIMKSAIHASAILLIQCSTETCMTYIKFTFMKSFIIMSENV